MQGWKPTTNQYDTMYDQLFYYYFEYPTETEKQIRLISKCRPLTWFPPQWFERSQPLPSGRMGQVYLTECRLPYTTKRLVVREINLCMITQVYRKKKVALFKHYQLINIFFSTKGKASVLFTKSSYWYHSSKNQTKP
jgi:hypothetical protein